MRGMIVTGTGTDVGKTVATAAVAALGVAAGERVAVVKPAQTGVGPGEPGDVDVVARLVPSVRVRELARYPEPLAPATAARRAGAAPVTVEHVVEAVRETDADLVLVEGAGGLLVRLKDDDDGGGSGTIADVAAALGVPALLVASAGLGVLSTAALSAEALARRGVALAGVVVGWYPADPGLAERTNLDDLPTVTGAPLLGVLPAGLGGADPDAFRAAAARALAPALGGCWHTAST